MTLEKCPFSIKERGRECAVHSTTCNVGNGYHGCSTFIAKFAGIMGTGLDCFTCKMDKLECIAHAFFMAFFSKLVRAMEKLERDSGNPDGGDPGFGEAVNRFKEKLVELAGCMDDDVKSWQVVNELISISERLS